MASHHKRNGAWKTIRMAAIGWFVFILFISGLAGTVLIRPADALLGVGDVSVTVGDIPRALYESISKSLKTAADVAFKNVLKTYLNNLAYNYAVKFATGEKGQKPLFTTEPEKLLTQAADSAAGDFLDSLATKWTATGHCEGAPQISCTMEGFGKAAGSTQCPEVQLSCPSTIDIDCNGSLENKEQCLLKGCTVIECDNLHEDCPSEEWYDAFDQANAAAAKMYGPEYTRTLKVAQSRCITNFSLCSQPKDIEIQLQLMARKAISGEGYDLEGRCPLTTIIDANNLPFTQREGKLLGIDFDPRKFDRALSPEEGKFYLLELSKSFNPEATQTGAYLAILEEGKKVGFGEKEAAQLAAQLEGDTKSVRSTITKVVKTPSSLIRNTFGDTIGKAVDPYLTYTGTAIADAVGVFTNTLASKMMERFFDCGFDLNCDSKNSGSKRGSGLANFIGGSSPGISAAKLLFADLEQTSYSVGGVTDTLSALSSCPDKANQTPDTCVIDSRFRTAIDQGLTVRQALDKKLLDGSKPFGFSGDKEPDYLNGYPYRSLLILRKYRIIPVGWELAAEYMRDYAPGDYSLNTLIREYDNPRSPFYRLIDPNWVLTAPEVTCQREGAGAKVVSSIPIRDTDTNADGKVDTADVATNLLTRQDDYCADEQTCLLEDDNGNCKYYGYCVEDKPIWRFDGTACLAQYASCQTVESPAVGQLSLLMNTVDRNGCNAQNAGCQWYCRDYDAATGQYTCANETPATSLAAQDYISFNGNVQSCGASDEGCTGFIRGSGDGANLVVNSGFEQYDGIPAGFYDAIKDSDEPDNFSPWLMGGEAACGDRSLAVSDAYEGFTAVRLRSGPDCGTSLGGHYFYQLSHAGYLTDSRTFTLSFYAKQADDPANCTDTNGKLTASVARTAGGGAIDYAGTGEISLTSAWTRYTVTGTFSPYVWIQAALDNRLHQIVLPFFERPTGDMCDVIIDGVQLEESTLSAYKAYEDSPKTYLQQAPAYLGCTGNTATDDPACANYALVCSEAEIGCDAYTSTTTKQTINGVISNPNSCVASDPASCDQCPVEFAGCRAFREMPIERMPFRESRDPVSFMPESGTSCPASAVGCEEYTNLETVAQGGEGKEYYSYVRMCVMPDDLALGTYYTWEGSDEFGYQLREYTVKRSNLDAGPCTNIGAEGDPRLGASDWPACIDNFDYNTDGIIDFPAATCTAADMATNPDCAEFYDTSGNTFYRLRSRLVYASEDCKSYRNTIDGPDMIYHMVPGEGVSCQARYAGCREYKGNAADAIRLIYSEQFESGTVEPWIGDVTYSNESVNDREHSMLVANSGAVSQAGSTLGFTSGRSYTFSFWAKSGVGADTSITASFATPTPLTFPGQALAKANDWLRFELGPLYVPETTDLSAVQLVLYSDNAFFIDNITITEVAETLTLVKDSYTECSGYEGCDGYRDRNKQVHYLKSFTRLCAESKVGCEVMIDTRNTESPDAINYAVENYRRGDLNRDGLVGQADIAIMEGYTALPPSPQWVICDVDGSGTCNYGPLGADTQHLRDYVNGVIGELNAQNYRVEGAIGKDAFKYLVNDPAKSCAASAAGCERLGKPTIGIDGTVSSYEHTYLVNNPDTYDEIMCYFSESGCLEFSGGGSSYYFKNPGAKLCTYGSGPETGWYISSAAEGVPNCPVANGVCSGGLRNGALCNSNDDCDGSTCTRNPKIVAQPTDGWVGLCEPAASGCTEYRDPEYIEDETGIAVIANYVSNGGFESFDLDPNPAAATDGVKDTGVPPLVSTEPDIFTSWASTWVDAGVPCGVRMQATNRANTGDTAAMLRSYADCPVTPDHDEQRYIHQTFDTGSLSDNGSFTVSLYARIDPNDASCDLGNPGNYTFSYRLERVIDDREGTASYYVDDLDDVAATAATSWDRYQSEFTYGAAPVAGHNWFSADGPLDLQQREVRIVLSRPAPPGPVDAMCDILIDTVRVTEAASPFDYASYYYLSGTVGPGDCNGLVNREEGCRLFSDTNQPMLPYSSELSLDGAPPVTCDGGTSCDANTILKVRSDRECKRWLECETSVRQTTATGVEDLCLSRFVCDALDPDTGACVHKADLEAVNQTYSSPAFAELIKYQTGMAFPGLEWGRRCVNDPTKTCADDADCGPGDRCARRCTNDNSNICTADIECGPGGTCAELPQIIEGTMPVASMEQVGEVTSSGDAIKYGDFGDSTYELNQAIGLRLSQDATRNDIDVINIPTLNEYWLAHNAGDGEATILITEENINTGQIPSPNANLDENNVAHVQTSGDSSYLGLSYRLGASLSPTKDYYVSFKLKWSGVPATQDRVIAQLAYLGADESEIDYATFGIIVPTDQWQDVVLGPVTVGLNDAVPKSEVDYQDLRLNITHVTVADPVPSVDFYLDDVSLLPVLQIREEGDYMSRDCRLYPQSDSPLCNYTDENGIIYQGWKGYCLERDPRNSQYCLQWYPIDILLGESNVFGLPQDRGYEGRRPLYMCAASGGNYNSNIINSGLLIQTASWDVCNEMDTLLGRYEEAASPLLGRELGYRHFVQTEMHSDKGNAGDDSDCDPLGDIEDWAAFRTGTLHGVSWWCDSDWDDGCEIATTHWDLDDADKFYKWQIEKIAVIGQAWSHKNWDPTDHYTNMAWYWWDRQSGKYTPRETRNTPDGPAYMIFETSEADQHQTSWGAPGWTVWSQQWKNNSGTELEDMGNYFTFNIYFDDNDRLARMEYTAYDNGHEGHGSGGGFAAAVVIYLKEECREVVQVASIDSAKAWTARTNGAENFLVPQLLYAYSQDYLPYGGLVQPAVNGGPENWRYEMEDPETGAPVGPLYVEKRSGDFARSGSPYSFINKDLFGTDIPYGGSSRYCTAFVGGSTYPSMLNECRNKADTIKCFKGPDGKTSSETFLPSDDADNGYCIGTGAGFCEKDASRFCTPLTAVADCEDTTGNYGPCVVGVCRSGNNEGEYCGGTCNGGTYRGRVCGRDDDCLGGGQCVYRHEDGTDHNVSEQCPASVCDLGGQRAGSNTDTEKISALEQVFAQAISAWEWNEVDGEYQSNSALLGPWNDNYYDMNICNYASGVGFTRDKGEYCGIPATISNIKVDKATVSAGGVVQLSFDLRPNANQTPITEIVIDWGDDTLPAKTIGTFGGGRLVFLHEYHQGGVKQPSISVRDNWDWCGVSEADAEVANGCPAAMDDCRGINAMGSPEDCGFASDPSARVNVIP